MLGDSLLDLSQSLSDDKESWALGMLGPGMLERFAGMLVSDGGKAYFL